MLRATQVIIVDGDGNAAATLGVLENGTVGLTIGSAPNSETAFLGTQAGRASLQLSGSDGAAIFGAGAARSSPKEGQPLVTPTPASSADPIVYVTKSGTKYHTASCRYAKTGTSMKLSEAQGRYGPCSVCEP